MVYRLHKILVYRLRGQGVNSCTKDGYIDTRVYRRDLIVYIYVHVCVSIYVCACGLVCVHACVCPGILVCVHQMISVCTSNVHVCVCLVVCVSRYVVNLSYVNSTVCV